jgi:PPOX class probable F420-dependent enzyme
VTPTDELWRIVAGGRNGILATINPDGTPQLSNIYFLADVPDRVIRFSTTLDRIKGRNLVRDGRAVLHIPGRNFFNFAVVSGSVTVFVPELPDDTAIDELFEVHSGLGAASDREGFGHDMLAKRRMAVRLHVERIYGQVLDRP